MPKRVPRQLEPSEPDRRGQILGREPQGPPVDVLRARVIGDVGGHPCPLRERVALPVEPRDQRRRRQGARLGRTVPRQDAAEQEGGDGRRRRRAPNDQLRLHQGFC